MVSIELGEHFAGFGISSFVGQNFADVFRGFLIGRQGVDIAEHQHGGKEIRLGHGLVSAAADGDIDLLHHN